MKKEARNLFEFLFGYVIIILVVVVAYSIFLIVQQHMSLSKGLITSFVEIYKCFKYLGRISINLTFVVLLLVSVGLYILWFKFSQVRSFLSRLRKRG